MATTTNRIGSLNFITLARVDSEFAPPLIVGEQSITNNRPASNGTEVIKLGRKAEPFEMISGVDADTIAQALDAAEFYNQMQNNRAYSLVWRGVDMTQYQTQYIVLRVDPIHIGPLKNGVYLGAALTSQAFIRARWLLQPEPLLE